MVYQAARLATHIIHPIVSQSPRQVEGEFDEEWLVWVEARVTFKNEYLGVEICGLPWATASLANINGPYHKVGSHHR